MRLYVSYITLLCILYKNYMTTKRYIEVYSHSIFVIVKIWQQLRDLSKGKCTKII